MKMTQIASGKPLLSIKNAYAGSIVYPPGGDYGPRYQAELQLVLLHSGSMNILIDDCVHKVPVGHVALLKPGHTEKFVFAKSEETWHRWITVALESANDELINELNRLPFHLPISDKMNQLTSLMLEFHFDHSQDNNEVLCSLGQSSIWLYVTECRKQVLSKVHPAVLKAKDIIQEKFRAELSLTDLASESGVTPEHLIRLFQKHEQMTPVQFLWNYRVQRGIELLRNSGLQIGEVAYQTGFKTSYHFARLVKKHVGKTPTEIRKQSWHQLK
jgi:AraC family transcriptional regulator of arabinose operon